MPFLRLLSIALVVHLSGAPAFAQEPNHSSEAPGESAWKNLKTAGIGVSVITITIAGGLAITYELMRAINGKGSYHINQFRIHFIGDDAGTTPLELSKRLEEIFPKVFDESSVARAKRISESGPVVIRFTPHNIPAKAFRLLTWRRRHDDVVLARPDPNESVFQGITLDPKSDPFGSNKRRKWFRWVNAQLDSIAYCHFLAGTRSWRVGPSDLPADGQNAPIYFLETAAFERSSSHLMANVPFLRGTIRTVWCEFVLDSLKALKIPPIAPEGIGRLDAPAIAGTTWSKRIWIWDSKPERRVEIWYREVQFAPDKIRSFASDVYASRLFELHPGLKKEFELVKYG